MVTCETSVQRASTSITVVTCTRLFFLLQSLQKNEFKVECICCVSLNQHSSSTTTFATGEKFFKNEIKINRLFDGIYML